MIKWKSEAYVLASCIVAGSLCYGCAWYKAQPFTPYNMTVTESVDRHGGNLTHSVGFDFDLKPDKK